MITILDFYVDEPACLGVPPYFAPYCRYVAGALACSGIPQEKIKYLTVDKWRTDKGLGLDSELVILIAGFTVPGKYLGGKIGTAAEVSEFLGLRRLENKNSTTLVGGPIRFAPDSIRENINRSGGLLIDGDVERFVFETIRYSKQSGLNLTEVQKFNLSPGNHLRSNQQISEWSTVGAFVTSLHPNYPYLINELETYRGCTRLVKCSFCTEAFYGDPDFREQSDIKNEVRALNELGNQYFRLGRQADLLTYGSDSSQRRSGFPKPRPKEVEILYEGIREAAPDLKMLHLDNINPGLIANYPEEAKQILETIAHYNTPGDTAAMGVESVDDLVRQVNSLKCDRSEAMKAIELVNEAGGRREGGIPKLLPGLNFIHGLPGESDKTFQENYEFLKEVLDNGLLLRRINIRQITIHQGSTAEKLSQDKEFAKELGFELKRHKRSVLEKKFKYFRDKIRQEIDRPMLEKVFPRGTLIRELIPEFQNLGYTFGRQLGSYPVTVKIPIDDRDATEALEQKKPIDVIITGYQERSVTGISHPIKINLLGHKALAQIPGIGKKRATTIFLKRPLTNLDELQGVIDGPFWGNEDDYMF